jgi:glutamate-5-semialdehyde dehydrogenase
MTKAPAISIKTQCQLAFEAKETMATLSSSQKIDLLTSAAIALLEKSPTIIAENQKDIAYGHENNLTPALIDRLTLTEERVRNIVDDLKTIAALPDPVGITLSEKTLPNQLELKKISVPLGVIGMIYEARPNVTSDAIALAIKSGNCVVLKGSSSATYSNKAIASIFKDTLEQHHINSNCIQLLEDTSREGVKTLVKQHETLSLVIPRGSGALIQSVVQNATVPSLETGVGNCHIYVETSANQNHALDIILNAKTQRPSVCNACETILIHSNIAKEFLPKLVEKLGDHVELRGCETTRTLISQAKAATEDDWHTEFLDLILAIKVVNSTEEAIAHIKTYGTLHSEAIISEDKPAIQQFSQEVDAACILVNASTRFVDGSQFGFGAEIGIATQKLHARGPVGLPELCTYKYIVTGSGQIRT